MSEQIFNKIHELLSKNEAKFRVIEHESARTSEEVTALADCVFGSVPPFSFHKNLHLVVDESLLERNEEIAFNAGLLNRSVVLNAKDYARIVKPVFVKFAKEKC